jgi:hypothetical protein
LRQSIFGALNPPIGQLLSELGYIKNLRALTGYSISDIREDLNNKSAFFAADTSGNEGEENEQLIIKILQFAKKQGDKIMIVQEMPSGEQWEITEEIFMNEVNSHQQTKEYFRELDELEEDDL